MEISTGAGKKFFIKRGGFEGPLELLLELIERRKLFISDISLAAVADEYMAYVRDFDDFPMADAAQFILTASTLVLIKSRSLLPGVKLTEEETGDIKDLERRLALYQETRDRSRHIAERFGKCLMLPPQRSEDYTNPVQIFAPARNIAISTAAFFMRNLLANLPKKERLPRTLVQKVVSLEETIERLVVRLRENFTERFREFAHIQAAEKVDIIVSFLAMLELVKQGMITVRQRNDFADIEMESGEINVPHY